MTRYINSPKVSVWKISASILLLTTAGLVAPTLSADEPASAPSVLMLMLCRQMISLLIGLTYKIF